MTSSLHKYFEAITTLTPLKFQQRLTAKSRAL